MAALVILVEATPRNPADGTPETVRLAGAGAVVPYNYGDQHWRAGLAGLPQSVATFDFDGEQLGGGGVAQAMELSWTPASSSALAEVSSLYWTDAPIVVRIGPEGDALPPVVANGLVLDTAIDTGTLKIPLADEAADLKRALLVDRYAGTGGIEGPVDFEGRIKPRAWGRCFNVLGVQLNAANNIWSFGDPQRPWAAFDQIRDKGVAAAPAALSILLWQGSVDATFAALCAAQATEGGGVVCPSIACVKWWTVPAGDLHADIRGEIEGGYVETAPEIVARIVAARSSLAFAPGAVADAAAARPAPFGWRVESDSATAASEISTMLTGVSLSWMLIDGAVTFRRWEWSAPTRVARSHSVTRKSTVKPVASRKLGYRRNWSPMARGDLAALVLAGDVTYADGTPVEALKPATPGATAGAPDITLVGHTVADDGTVSGGQPAGAVIAALDINADGIIALALRQDDAETLAEARNFIAGQPVATLLVNFRNAQTTTNTAVQSNFDLLGGKTADGTGWVLNGASVQIGGGKTLAQSLTELGASNAANTASVTTLSQAIVGDGTSYANAIMRADANGVFGAFSITANGITRKSAITLVASEMSFVSDLNGSPVAPFSIIGNAVYATNFIASTITYDSLVQRFTDVGRQNLDPSGWYQELPGGLIMQGGRYRGSIDGETTFSITFPKPFPNQVLATGAMPFLSSFSNVRDLWMQNVGEPNTNGTTFATQAATNNQQHVDGFDWWAWGR